MSDNIKKSPENKESSPIRELFHKSKDEKPEAVKEPEQEKTESGTADKDEPQENAEEKKDTKEIKTTNEEKSEKTDVTESESEEEEFEDDLDDEDVETVPEPEVHEKHIGLRAVLSKMVEIITAPEDNEMFLGNEEEFEDIFSEDPPEPQVVSDPSPSEEKQQKRSKSKKKELPSTLTASSLYTPKKKKPKDKPEPETVKAAEVKKPEPEKKEEIKKETETQTAKQPEIRTVPEETAQKPTETKTEEKKASETKKKEPEAAEDNRAKITVDEILKAKNSVSERASVAYGSMDTVDKPPADDDDTALPIFVKQQGRKKQKAKHKNPSEANQTEQMKMETPPINKGELSHDLPVKAETPPPVNKGELSHDVPVKAETPPPVNKSELSHDVPVRKTTAEKQPEIKNETEKKESAEREVAAERFEPMVYKAEADELFIVMAGKFTKTLRTEYENVRRLKAELPPPEPPAPVEPEEKPIKQPAVKETAKKTEQNETPQPEHHTPKRPKPKVKQKASKTVKVEPKKPKKRFRLFESIFSAENDRFDYDEETEEEKPELEDYNSESDGEEIKSDISENFRKVFVRTVVLTCTSVISIITSIIAQSMPWVFLNMMKNGWLVYSIISFLLFLVAAFAGRYPIVNGLMPLKRLKGNSDTPVSVATVAVAIQSIISLFQPNVFLDGTYHLYVPLISLALLLNSMGKLLIIRRTADNFRFLRRKDTKFAGKIYTKNTNAEKFASGLPSRRPLIAYTKHSNFMSNFLQLSYSSDPVEELSAKVSPFTAALSLLCGIIYGIMTKDFVGGVTSFAITACITTPMCSLVAVNIPMMNLCSSTLRHGSMIVGYEAVKQFCDTNALMIDSSQLYPKGSIILSGYKTFDETKLEEALSAGAAITFAVNGSLTHVFETMVQDRKRSLPYVDSVSYDDEMGLSGWVDKQRVLIGNRNLLSKHNIKLPDESIELKYRRMGNEVAYISVGGQLVVMLVLTYKADRAIAESLRELEDDGVSFIVRTIDPNITQKHIADKFSLYPRCIKILPTGLGNIGYEELSGNEKTSRAYLVTNGKLSSFARAVAGCIKIKSTVTIAKIIQYLSIIIGFILVTVISFLSGFAKLGSMEMLLYTGFWCAAMIIVSIAARKFL
ncbi:MAG: hypothetical protein IJ192_11780 [Clostridia bacterium]|nr:hypothetical protein [Clostridia bacterium]